MSPRARSWSPVLTPASWATPPGCTCLHHDRAGGVLPGGEADPRLANGVRRLRSPASGSISLQGNGSRPSMYRALKSVKDLPPAARLTAGHQSAAP